MSKYEEIFSKLDDWRLLPNYQLERRADIFFALYLPVILEKLGDCEKCSSEDYYIIPEFPVKTIGEDIKTNKPSNIDYAVFCKKCEKVYFIELKTDAKSFRNIQLGTMNEAANKDMKCLVRDIFRITETSNSKLKYYYLLDKIIKLFAKYPNFENVKPIIYYLGPSKLEDEGSLEGEKKITFKMILKHEELGSDKLSEAFIDSLRKWEKSATEELQELDYRKNVKRASLMEWKEDFDKEKKEQE